MGSTGEVRSRAWICGFSSTAKTAAFAGGARYRPTTSRILSISSGSGEILKSSARHGCSPNARQMRCTLDGEIPTRLASSRLDQCVAPSGTSSSVRTTTSSTWASLMVRGTPGRGSSPSPSSRLARKRVRHFLTVARLMPSRAATAILGPPSAQAKTIRARSASPCAVFRRFAQFSSVRRSASDSTSGSSLVSPMPPADRGPTASSPPSRDLKQNTTHVVMRKPKTGTLAHRLPLGGSCAGGEQFARLAEEIAGHRRPERRDRGRQMCNLAEYVARVQVPCFADNLLSGGDGGFQITHAQVGAGGMAAEAALVEVEPLGIRLATGGDQGHCVSGVIQRAVTLPDVTCGSVRACFHCCLHGDSPRRRNVRGDTAGSLGEFDGVL